MKADKAQIDYYITVAKDDSGDYNTIQEAINSAKAFPDKRITIFVKNGTYHEKVKVHSWNNLLTIEGQHRDSTIITFDDYFDKIDKGRNSTFMTPTVLVQGRDCVLKNLTIENTAGPVGQAVALAIEADRCVVKHCNLMGNQDTFYAAGEGNRQYLTDCYIEGTTDFIFGEATVVFEKCNIHAKSNSYITAASTPKDVTYGLVFIDCSLTADQEINRVYLGRPWRQYAKTVFIYCKLGEFILPEGWHNWSNPAAERTAFYAEYQNSGNGDHPKQRVTWSHQLKKSEAEKYTVEQILNHSEAKNEAGWYLK
ncbi:pectinesterase family protein [Fulvivirga maritima]|uniref:pectinesterase family protein n=1 Tax=Fulvivirga maritima TaxID=2904247 RepID=UPI001F1D6EF2|nr:pectinesterase family protein [Fulvivirga maritima]UII27145.1 pectinesterase family protein [Fulvivirga maritima]